MRISDWSSDVCSSDLAGLSSNVFETSAYLFRRSRYELQYTVAASMNGFSAVAMPPSDTKSCHAVLISAFACSRLYCSYWPTANTLPAPPRKRARSEEHTSELQSLMRTSYAVLCLKKKN